MPPVFNTLETDFSLAHEAAVWYFADESTDKSFAMLRLTAPSCGVNSDKDSLQMISGVSFSQ